MDVERVACFIDGFNLYHAIARLGRPHVKWLDLRRLMQRYVHAAARIGPVALVPRNQMDVQVRNRLPGGSAISIASRIARRSAGVVSKNEPTWRCGMTSTCPGDTGNPSRNTKTSAS